MSKKRNQEKVDSIIEKVERIDPSNIDTKNYPHLSLVNKIWKITTSDSTKYSVMQDEPQPSVKHLRIMRYDKKPCHNWMHIQAIKNRLWHNECVAIEIYPSQNQFVNCSNQYHLWTWSDIAVPNLKEIYEYL